MKTAGIILCGGQSSRMGRPKAWLPFGDELMLPRVARLLSEVVAPIVVVAAPGQDVPPVPPEIEIVRDEEKGRGPLQGLAAGLNAIGVGPRDMMSIFQAMKQAGALQAELIMK